MERGEIGILNVGAGDTKLTFDKAKPEDRLRAAKVVEDMLRRGFAIMVQVGEKDGKPIYQRAEGFDPETCEYIIMGLPESLADEIEQGNRAAGVTDPEDVPARKGLGRRGPKPRRIKADETHAVSVARSAGG